MMTGITYVFFQILYYLAEEEKTIFFPLHKSPLSLFSFSHSISNTLVGADLGLCLWEITYNKLSNIKQKDHCRFRETIFY